MLCSVNAQPCRDLCSSSWVEVMHEIGLVGTFLIWITVFSRNLFCTSKYFDFFQEMQSSEGVTCEGKFLYFYYFTTTDIKVPTAEEYFLVR